MECSICNTIKQPTKETKNPCFLCDCCKKIICIDCSELSPSELRCIPLQKRILIYHCKRCRNFEFAQTLQDTITDKKKIIDDQETIIKLLNEKIETLEKANHVSYAGIVQQNKHGSNTTIVKNNLPKIIVKPKRLQDYQKTKDDVEKNVKLDELKVGVQSMKTLNSGSIVIKCRNKQEMDVLEQNIKNKLNDKYDVQLSKMRKPKIKIVNFNQDKRNEEIKKCIMDQNNIVDEIEVVYIKKTRNENKTVICECSPKVFNQIMRTAKLSIGWERYTVYEDLDIPRCYKCQGYYHNSQQCQSKVVCSLCAEDHPRENCPKDKMCCANCINSNIKFKTKYPTDHHATDPECNTLKYFQQVLKDKTTYSEY